MLVSIFWANYERTFDKWLRYIVDIFWSNLWKKPKGFFKQWLKGILVGFLWSNSQFAHWVYWDQSGEFFLNKLMLYPLGLLRAKWEINLQKSSIYPVSILRVYCLKTLKKPSIYPLCPQWGKSVKWCEDVSGHVIFELFILTNFTLTSQTITSCFTDICLTTSQPLWFHDSFPISWTRTDLWLGCYWLLGLNMDLLNDLFLNGVLC